MLKYILLLIPLLLLTTGWVWKPAPLYLTDFDSLQELRDFLEADPSDHQLFVVSGEPLSGQCENRAFQLRENAALIGKRLETEVLTQDEYYRYYGKRIISLHMICKAIIGNDGFYIEPSTDRVWKGFVLD